MRKFEELDKRLENGSVILAIDGPASSGKTTLAASLLSKYDCTVFHMDDFFLTLEKRSLKRLNEVGGNIDYERFMEEIRAVTKQDIQEMAKKLLSMPKLITILAPEEYMKEI